MHVHVRVHMRLRVHVCVHVCACSRAISVYVPCVCICVREELVPHSLVICARAQEVNKRRELRSHGPEHHDPMCLCTCTATPSGAPYGSFRKRSSVRADPVWRPGMHESVTTNRPLTRTSNRAKRKARSPGHACIDKCSALERMHTSMQLNTHVHLHNRVHVHTSMHACLDAQIWKVRIEVKMNTSDNSDLVTRTPALIYMLTLADSISQTPTRTFSQKDAKVNAQMRMRGQRRLQAIE